MLINKNIFKEILDFSNKLNLPIDTLISKYILKNKNRKCFGFYPHIITSNVEEISNTDNKKRNLGTYLQNNRLKMEDFDI